MPQAAVAAGAALAEQQQAQLATAVTAHNVPPCCLRAAVQACCLCAALRRGCLPACDCTVGSLRRHGHVWAHDGMHPDPERHPDSEPAACLAPFWIWTEAGCAQALVPKFNKCMARLRAVTQERDAARRGVLDQPHGHSSFQKRLVASKQVLHL